MNVAEPGYRTPPRQTNAAGTLRTVGFELEFTGLTLSEAGQAVSKALAGQLTGSTAAEMQIETEELGTFLVEVDWSFLKKLAREHQDYQQELSMLSDTASLLVPVEVVCPPLAINCLSRLDSLVNHLRQAGARGTDDSPFAAYGVHINTEIPEQSATMVDAYLKAFCLLQWWLVDKHQVNLTRRITPYVDLYPDRYLKRVIASRNPSLEQIISDYLHYNPTRNRALDMLPLFKEINPALIEESIDDARVKARPTFHYRLPNCVIDAPDWSLAESWNVWCLVEELACQPQQLAMLCDEFLLSWRPAFGVDESAWIARIEQWRKQSGLA
ncbi:MAG: amidoligase family protein [Gammaproteobacteria bacterium]|nr:amidoligase family protein [Pseudomonadales bacterium]MCP5348873.1 amidoligase family protein [Pseudomonadales bacterium]